MYGSRDKVRKREFFVILGHFLPFTLLTICKIKIKKRKKSSWRYYYFTYVYHNDHDIMYGFWNIELNGQNFLSFWIFCPFTMLTTRKIKTLKKIKKAPGHTILQLCTINDNLMMYSSWDMEHNRTIFCHFGPFFAFLPCLITHKIKILKK